MANGPGGVPGRRGWQSGNWDTMGDRSRERSLGGEVMERRDSLQRATLPRDFNYPR